MITSKEGNAMIKFGIMTYLNVVIKKKSIMQNLIAHATMALTDMQCMSYEPPRMGLPPARERRVACGEARDGSFGVPSSTKTKFLCVAPPP